MIFEKILEILEEFKDFDRASVTMDTTFESMGLDSLDIVDLVMKIEDVFKVTIPMDKDSFKSVGSVVTFVEKEKSNV